MSLSYNSAMRGILFTDQYQLTMAQLYFRHGLHEMEVQFDHFYRRNPDYDQHQAGYCINAGLEWFLDWMQQAHFRDSDLDYLRGHRNAQGNRLFADDFLDYLRHHGNFDGLSIRAIPEGRVVHPNTPLTIVRGPMAMAQIVETPLLNKLNYSTLVATKASRLVEASRGGTILEFGLRRAQGEGANDGTRAALIGGAHFSSNVGVSHVLGLPPKGTHAHSMVQLMMALGEGEIGAFRAYAELYPDDCLLLVDTVDTLQSGVPNAIKVFEELRRKGHRPAGIRLDSGDQAYLSIQAAKMLDEAGFDECAIVLSSDLDELVIWQIITQIQHEAPRYGVDADKLIKRLVYGVGTRLITSWGEPALGGVYKLVAVKKGDDWSSAIKISESPSKTPTPGAKQAWRIYDQRQKATADLLTLEDEVIDLDAPLVLRHPSDHTKQRTLQPSQISRIEPLHAEIVRQGQLVYDLPSLEELRRRRFTDVEALDPGVRRLVNPHIYHVSLSEALWGLKQELIAEARRSNINSES
ncbi:MAG TPA: nicotinate phosphoribosyltransferase [Chloroflexi bacterium]|nr:nicotinate phosphoribosyltransferase [Chloroflexota bacterium]HHW88136.1 nicotinate phosphoribosyltransferase [Chloroflexota bacterium]